MGFRFRKSKKIGGIRLNFSHKGVGYSVGNKYLGFSHSATGRRTVRTSIPGTGISYSTSRGGKSSGGCLLSFFKLMFGLVFLPITIIIYLVKHWNPQKTEQKHPTPTNQTPEESRTTCTPEHIHPESYMAESYRTSYTRQLNETLKILEETNNIATFFSRMSFLRQLRKNILTYGSGDLSDLVDIIEDHLDMREEHIDLFLLKRFGETEEKVAGASPAVVRRSYKALYNRFDGYKSRMCEENIRMYTTRCQQRIGVDTLNLPVYSKLLTRLNNSLPGAAIAPEYYEEWFGSTSEAVQFLKQKGYLTTTEDNKKYALTELGLQEVGWL